MNQYNENQLKDQIANNYNELVRMHKEYRCKRNQSSNMQVLFGSLDKDQQQSNQMQLKTGKRQFIKEQIQNSHVASIIKDPVYQVLYEPFKQNKDLHLQTSDIEGAQVGTNCSKALRINQQYNNIREQHQKLRSISVKDLYSNLDSIDRLTQDMNSKYGIQQKCKADDKQIYNQMLLDQQLARKQGQNTENVEKKLADVQNIQAYQAVEQTKQLGQEILIPTDNPQFHNQESIQQDLKKIDPNIISNQNIQNEFQQNQNADLIQDQRIQFNQNSESKVYQEKNALPINNVENNNLNNKQNQPNPSSSLLSKISQMDVPDQKMMKYDIIASQFVKCKPYDYNQKNQHAHLVKYDASQIRNDQQFNYYPNNKIQQQADKNKQDLISNYIQKQKQPENLVQNINNANNADMDNNNQKYQQLPKVQDQKDIFDQILKGEKNFRKRRSGLHQNSNRIKDLFQ